MKTNPLHATANAQVGPKAAELIGQDPHYLAHEYFNRDWQPMDFADMAEYMAHTKLEYASTANYLDLIEAINLTQEQMTLLAEIPDTALRENTRDFCVDKKFRKDYWVNGAINLTQLQVLENLRAERVVMTKPRGTISLVLEGALGVVDLAADIYNPILDYLADYQPRTLAQIEEAMAAHGTIGLQEIVQALFIFTHRGEIQSAQPDEVIEQVLARTQALNNGLIDRARGSADIAFLASPVTGGGIEATRYQQLFVKGYREGCESGLALAHYVWMILQSMGEGIMKMGRYLQNEDEILAELTERAEDFLRRDLAMFQGLRLI